MQATYLFEQQATGSKLHAWLDNGRFTAGAGAQASSMQHSHRVFIALTGVHNICRASIRVQKVYGTDKSFHQMQVAESGKRVTGGRVDFSCC